MSILRSLLAPVAPRADAAIPFDEWASWITGLGASSLLFNPQLNGTQEEIPDTFASLATSMFKANPIIFGAETRRLQLFSQARFRYRRLRSGVPGELFSTSNLGILDDPFADVLRSTMLKYALLDADFGGIAFITERGGQLKRMRPDWTTLVFGSERDDTVEAVDLDAVLLGAIYHSGGKFSGRPPVTLLREQFAEWVPSPDPTALRRGIPWVASVIPEVMADKAATHHKLKFFENGATPQMIVSLDPAIRDPKKFREWVDLFDQNHSGAANAYRTVYLGAGANASVVGANLRQMDFRSTQGAGETRIAVASGVPAVLLQISEGLQGSSLNQGNYAMAMRQFADLSMRDLWGSFAHALQRIIPTPSDAELWYDDGDIPALKEDIRDRAEVQQLHSGALRQLTDAGWTPASAKQAVITGDWSVLEHSGLYSVQLQKPGVTSPPLPGQAPVAPAGTPAAIAGEVRCSCGALLAEYATAPFRITCRRCKEVTSLGVDLDIAS